MVTRKTDLFALFCHITNACCSGAVYLKVWYFSNDYDSITLLEMIIVTLLIVYIANNVEQLLKESKIYMWVAMFH